MVLCLKTGDLLCLFHCYRGISLLSVVCKNICRDPNRVHRGTEGLIDDEQEGFRVERVCAV